VDRGRAPQDHRPQEEHLQAAARGVRVAGEDRERLRAVRACVYVYVWVGGWVCV
jgi:hypothetical protein